MLIGPGRSDIRWLAQWCLCAGTAACVEEHLAPAPPSSLPPLAPTSPDAPGPYRVGVATLETESEGRVLPIEVWYPAHPPDGAEVARYPFMIGLVELASLASPHGAVRDAPLAREGSPHPVVVFSHGFGGTRIQSVYLTEYLASHGYVVAAPDHVGNTFSDLGTLTPGQAARVRPVDVTMTLDTLLEASDTWPGALYMAADPERVAIAGHSFGGFTAFRIAGATIDAEAARAACAEIGGFVCEGWETNVPSSQRDERFRSALALTPGGALAFTPNGFSTVDVPVMIHAGTHDDVTPYAEEQRAPFDALPSPAYLVTLEGAGHYTFSDVCELMDQSGLQLEALSNGCGPEDIDHALAHALSNTYAVAFFKKTIENDAGADAWLSGSAALPEGVAELERK